MLPFLLAILIVSGIGVFTVTRLVASTIQERFSNQLLDSAAAAHNAITDIEREQLANLRLMVFVSGLDDAVIAGDSQQSDALLRPLAANALADGLVVYDALGRGLVYLRRVDDLPGVQYEPQTPPELLTWPGVVRSLTGVPDQQGDKYVDLVATPDGYLFFWSAPLKTADGQIVGGVSIGLRASRMAQMVGQQALSSVALYDPTGMVIGQTFRNVSVLDLMLEPAKAGLLMTEMTEASPLVERALTNSPYQLLYSPFNLRGQAVGLLAVGLPSNFIVERIGTSRDLLSALFAILFVVVLVLGIVTARSITRPLRKLVSATRTVRGGNLSERVGLRTPDELGELGTSFDLMTAKLAKRNRRIRQLYREQVEETARRETVLANISDAVFVQDMEARTVMHNAAAQNLVDRVRFIPGGMDKLQHLLWEPGKIIGSQLFELGDYLYSVVTQPIYTESEGRLGNVIVWRDVTEMFRAERLKDELILQMSHELRTPLTAVKSYLDLMGLIRAKDMGQKSSEYLGKATENLGTLQRLTDQVVDVSSIIAEQFHVDHDVFDLVPVLQQQGQVWQKRMAQRELDFKVSLPKQSLCVEGDPMRTGEVIDHVLRNAFDYSLPGGQVALVARQKGPRAIVVIADTGVGIARDEINHVFDRMFRGRAARAGETDSRGMGLGLYLSKHIIERQGGQITLASQVDEGTSVRIELIASDVDGYQ